MNPHLEPTPPAWQDLDSHLEESLSASLLFDCRAESCSSWGTRHQCLWDLNWDVCSPPDYPTTPVPMPNEGLSLFHVPPAGPPLKSVLHLLRQLGEVAQVC